MANITNWCLYVFCIYVSVTGLAVARRVRHWRSKNRPVNLVQDIDVEGYLKDFGYMDEIPAGIVGDNLRNVEDRDEQVSHAIRKFQQFYGLRATGRVDRETMKWMKTPRCGVADTEASRRKRSYPSRYTHLGSKWSKNRLTWKLTRPTHKLTQSDQKRTIRAAFNIWENVAPLSITETSGEPDMEIFFARGEHGDGKGNAFDGRSRVLAHAFGPGKAVISGDAHFDNDEDWTLDAGHGSDMLVVAAHEFGHSLGLGHSRDQGALMFPAYQSQTDLKLGQDDIRAIQTLYGSRISPGNTRPPVTRRPYTRPPYTRRPYTRRPYTRPPYTRSPYRPPTTPAPPTTTPETPKTCDINFDAIVEGSDRFFYAIRKGQVFKFKEEGLEPEFPKPMAEVFEKAPSEIDLAFSIARTSNIYIIKGNMVWRYTNMQLDENYPLEFNRKSFPEDPKFIMSLVDDRGKSRVILFGERKWWFYSFDEVLKSIPMKYNINSNWRGVPTGVQYSVRWRDNNYYLVTSGSHVVFDHNRRTASTQGEVSGLPPWLGKTCFDINMAIGSGHQVQPFILFTMATVMITRMMTWQ